MKALLRMITDPFRAPEPSSKMSVELQKSGAICVDVEGFLSSKQGKEELERAEQLWKPAVTK